MTKFFMKWWADPLKTPNTPEETVKLRLKISEMVKAELSAGRITEWGQFGNGIEGYAITEASEEDLYATSASRLCRLSRIRWYPCSTQTSRWKLQRRQLRRCRPSDLYFFQTVKNSGCYRRQRVTFKQCRICNPAITFAAVLG